MYYFITSSADTYITENQPGHIAQFRDSITKNYGMDEILELKKEFTNEQSVSPDNVSRVLLKFDYTKLSASLSDGTIPSLHRTGPTSASIWLRLYEVEGQTLSDNVYTLAAHNIAKVSSDNVWEEGTGKHFNNPDTIDGASWQDWKSGSAWNKGMLSYSGSRTLGGGIWFQSSYPHSQSFYNESGDINMNVTNLVSASIAGMYNAGIVLKFSGSEESSSPPIDLKFFSRQTNTIYQPKLEVRWNDSISNPSEPALLPLTMSGEVQNHIFIKGLKPTYNSSERVRFRCGARKKYVQKTFTESVLTSSYYVPRGSGSYSIVDSATNVDVVPFGPHTTMSVNLKSMYFDQWFDNFETGRYYKVLFKLKYTDGQEVIIDNDDEFKVI